MCDAESRAHIHTIPLKRSCLPTSPVNIVATPSKKIVATTRPQESDLETPPPVGQSTKKWGGSKNLWTENIIDTKVKL